MTMLWSKDEVARATQGHGAGEWYASGVSIDSRTLCPGDLFIALVGPSFDGHRFVKAALEAGASAAIIHRAPEDVDPADPRLLYVEDSFAALYDLARAARRRSNAKIIAVTGSVGKTGTKEMLKTALDAQAPTHASLGSLNNHWGVPLSLCRLDPAARYAVFELGMNHAGEIGPLSHLVKPDVAIITTIEAVHMEFFASTEAIAHAKAEIFEGVPKAGAAILNLDNRHFALLSETARSRGIERILGFGQKEEAFARLIECNIDHDKTWVKAHIGDHVLDYCIGVAGRQWAMNSLAVLAAIAAAGADIDKAAKALGNLSPPKGRGQRHRLSLPIGQIEVIDESYNASPVSMRAAFAVLAASTPTGAGRRIAVLGDMLELGEDSSAFHRDLAASAVENGIDLIFTAGPLMAELRLALPPAKQGRHAPSSDLLAPVLHEALQDGDIVMVKGSAGSRMNKIVSYLLDVNNPAGKD